MWLTLELGGTYKYNKVGVRCGGEGGERLPLNWK